MEDHNSTYISNSTTYPQKVIYDSYQELEQTTEKVILDKYWQIRNKIYLYYPIVLIIVACLGNSLSFAVFSRPIFSKMVTAFYFRCLTISDTATILLAMIPNVLEFHFNIRHGSSDFTCAILHFLRVMAYDYSIYILILVTLERFIGVWFPIKAMKICTMRKAVISVVAAGFLSALRNIYYFVLIKWVEHQPGQYTCYFPIKYYEFYTTVEPFLSLILSVIVPFIIILLLNTGIAICVFRANRQRAGMSSIAESSNSEQGSAKLTMVLMIVTFAFLIFAIPDMIRIIMIYFLLMDSPQLEVWYSLAYYITATNHAVNFFLYGITGTLFRREFCNMIKEVYHCLSRRDEA